MQNAPEKYAPIPIKPLHKGFEASQLAEGYISFTGPDVRSNDLYVVKAVPLAWYYAVFREYDVEAARREKHPHAAEIFSFNCTLRLGYAQQADGRSGFLKHEAVFDPIPGQMAQKRSLKRKPVYLPSIQTYITDTQLQFFRRDIVSCVTDDKIRGIAKTLYNIYFDSTAYSKGYPACMVHFFTLLRSIERNVDAGAMVEAIATGLRDGVFRLASEDVRKGWEDATRLLLADSVRERSDNLKQAMQGTDSDILF